MSLSYQHIYHAGNPADIQKQLWVLAVMSYLQKKDKPLFWCDTHAGRGLYDLNSSEAQKTQEFNIGIAKLYHETINHPLWHQLKSMIDSVNPSDESEIYPGSAMIAAMLLRPDDRMECYDLHPQEYKHLAASMRPFPNVTTRDISMEEGIFSCTPPKEKRGAVIIDPSYELKKEYQSIPKVVKRVMRKWPNATYMIWYPLLKAGRHEELKQTCLGIDPDVLIDEWIFADHTKDGFRGMYGTGMAVFNAPYSVPETMADLKESILPLLK